MWVYFGSREGITQPTTISLTLPNYSSALLYLEKSFKSSPRGHLQYEAVPELFHGPRLLTAPPGP